MNEYTKPLPEIGEENRVFWESAKKNELRMQKCTDCGHIRYPINSVCTSCLSDGFTWEKLSGRGTVFNKIIFHQVYHKGFAQDAPYNVVMIQLAEGPRMFSNVVGIKNEEINIGMAVEVVFDHVTDDIAIPKFQPLKRG
jgi:uncharacterized OB-fold protein